jgi:hypothetical protein
MLSMLLTVQQKICTEREHVISMSWQRASVCFAMQKADYGRERDNLENWYPQLQEFTFPTEVLHLSKEAQVGTES